jgi:hypothetical protein
MQSQCNCVVFAGGFDYGLDPNIPGFSARECDNKELRHVAHITVPIEPGSSLKLISRADT